MIININSNIDNEDNSKPINIKTLNVKINYKSKETEFTFYTKPNSKLKLIPSFDGNKNDRDLIDSLLFTTIVEFLLIDFSLFNFLLINKSVEVGTLCLIFEFLILLSFILKSLNIL